MSIKPLTTMPFSTLLDGSEIFYAQQNGQDVRVLASQFITYTAYLDIPIARGSTPYAQMPDMAAQIQAAMDAVPAGGTLFIPTGVYRLIGSGNQILNSTKPIRLIGVGNPIFSIDPTVPNTRDVIRLAPALVDSYGWQISNMFIGGFNGVPKGRHSIYIDTSAGPGGGWIINGIFSDNILPVTASGAALYLNNNTTPGGLAYSTISGNQLDSLSLGNCGDNNLIFSNIFDARGGTNEALFAYVASGGANLQIIGNVFTGNNIMLDLESGVGTEVAFNEFEANSVNSSTYVIGISAAGGLHYAPQLLNNSIVALAGSGITLGINVLTGVDGTVIQGGRIDVPAGGTHISIGAGALNTIIDEGSIQFSTGTVNGVSNISDSGGGPRAQRRPYFTKPGTVANLPAASAALTGAKTYVTNATATLTAGIGAIVAGGGANIVPVFCDGTNWRIG